MFKPIQFPAEVENLVRFVEETEPGQIIEATLAKLREGVSPRELLTAGALAVVRSVELPADHHGGPVHPICGIHGVYQTSQRLSGELALVPIVQHIALCNHHIHSRHMGPYIMPEIAPLEGKAGGMEGFEYTMRERAPEDGNKDTLEATKEAFQQNIHGRNSIAAEQNCLWLLENLLPGEVLDLMLPAAVSRNTMDDHYFIYPIFTVRALDCIGWEWASVLMRPVVRFEAREPFSFEVTRTLDFSIVEGLLDKYRLLEIDISDRTTQRETEAIGEVATRVGACSDYYDTIELIAKALADGLSLEGAGEALSIGASIVFLRSSYGNPMDSHLHTGANSRRYLLNMQGVSLRNKILALLTGITGPECIISEDKLNWSPRTDSKTLAALPERSQETLLDAITESIESQPWADWETNSNLGNIFAPPEVKATIALTQHYANLGYDPKALFVRLAELICRDDFTELHALKQHQSIVEEFYTTREPFRWVHLVSAAKSAAVIVGGKEQSVYKRTREMLKV